MSKRLLEILKTYNEDGPSRIGSRPTMRPLGGWRSRIKALMKPVILHLMLP
ncbi:MAG: hypothetical protein QXK53_01180 [Nitrososphaerota archaeon]